MRFAPKSVALSSLVLGLASAAQGDFVHWIANQYIGNSGGTDYHVIDVYAQFDQAGDRLINVFEVSLDLVGANSATFYQASVPGLIPASGLPALIILDADAYAFDSFVTVGALQGDLTNGTTADPSFDDPELLTFGTLTGCGWYNLPPDNGHGDAGASLQVLVGRFTIPATDWLTGANITWTATGGYTSDGVTLFGTESKTFYFKPPIVTPATTPEDFNLDSMADVVWGDPTSGEVHIWEMNGLTRTADVTVAQAIPTPAWSVVGSGDFDGDTQPDLVLKDPSNQYVVWFMANGVVTSTATISSSVGAAWVCLAVADIDGDGRADIVLRNTSTLEVRGWLYDGATKWNSGTIGTAGANLQFLTTADLDGNGTKDLVWRNSTNGNVKAWLLDGLTVTFNGVIANTTAVPSTWSLMMSADLDGDGKDDLVWRNNTNGNVNGWLMDGALKTAGGLIASGMSTNWVGVAGIDLDNDGDEDLVWRNTANNNVSAWIMDGLTKVSNGVVAPVGGASWTSFVH